MVSVKKTIFGLLAVIRFCQSQKDTEEPVLGTYVVCYAPDWPAKRNGTGRFTPLEIDPFLCTHLIYAFGALTDNSTLKPWDEKIDIIGEGYKNINGLKTINPRLQTLLAIGGTNEGSKRFSRISSTKENRKEFALNIVKYLREYDFDGINIDWQYPTFNDGSRPKDKENFVELLKDISEEFKMEAQKANRTRLLLTSTLPSRLQYVDKGYDIPKLSRYLDWMVLVTYDYRLSHDVTVKHHSPLFSADGNITDIDAEDSSTHSDVDATVRFYMKLGATQSKIMLGIPTYGRSFTLEKETETEIGSLSHGPGIEGEFSGEAGVLSYYEICARVKHANWTVKRPYPESVGPYAYKGNQWVTYDDREIIARKAQYVVDKGLGGISIWALDLDDFRGHCHETTYPLVRTARDELRKGWREKNMFGLRTSLDLAGQKDTEEPVLGTYVVCYAPDWPANRNGTGRFTPLEIDPFLCTHLIYAFGRLTDNSTLKPWDEKIDIIGEGYKNINGLKTINPRLQTLLAIGGTNEGSKRFSRISSTKENRKEFALNIVKYLREYDFDGINIDWQYPTFNDGSRPKDKENFVELLKDINEEFKMEAQKANRTRLLLTSTLPSRLQYVDRGYDIPKLSRYLDWMVLVTYDYRLSHDVTVKHHSPLFSADGNITDIDAEDSSTHSDVDATVRFYMKLGATQSKIMLGIPTYGRSFTLEKETETEIGSLSHGPGIEGEFSGEAGVLSYYEICARVKHANWTVKRPYPESVGPYAYKGNQWVTYDDREIIARKAQYVVDKGLGGISIWALDLDDFRGHCHETTYPLVRTARDELRKGWREKNIFGLRTSLDLADVVTTKKPASRRMLSSVAQSTSIILSTPTTSTAAPIVVTTTTSSTTIPYNFRNIQTTSENMYWESPDLFPSGVEPDNVRTEYTKEQELKSLITEMGGIGRELELLGNKKLSKPVIEKRIDNFFADFNREGKDNDQDFPKRGSRSRRPLHFYFDVKYSNIYLNSK